jgi:lipopolysaccharide export system ATP-binding protein
MAKLIAKNLAKSYKEHQVVKSVSMTIPAGKAIGLLGPNGAGKTTTFYMIVGFTKPNSGSIWIDDVNITHSAMHKRSKLGLGYLPQETSIFRKLSVKDNILAILQLKHKDKKKQQTKLDQLLNDFHLTHISHTLAASLSGGEKRRVEIARALAAEPKFLLLDEPFAGIDPISVNEIKETIQDLKAKGIGILITDHNVRETLSSCDHAYIMASGTIIAEGTSNEILANKKVKEIYLGEDFRL